MRGLRTRLRERIGAVWYGRLIRRTALTGLVWRTGNFSNVTWLGHPIWQNPLDAWAIQEALFGGDVDLVVECGTNRGGSALYMASIFDLIGRGHVITIDVERPEKLEHARVEFLHGSSTDTNVLAKVKSRIDALQAERVMVLLDSDHAGPHVLRELELYGGLVSIGGYVVVQDGCIDELRIMREGRPGPLWAIRQFVKANPEFEIDEDRSQRFLLSHSPSGWLRKVADERR
jgi:cephalosporin hydroxylase